METLYSLLRQSQSSFSCDWTQYKTQLRNWYEVEVNLRPTVSRPVSLGVGLPSGAYDQIFVFCLPIAGFLISGTLSDERMGL
jgi:hypothetical protein